MKVKVKVNVNVNVKEGKEGNEERKD